MMFKRKARKTGGGAAPSPVPKTSEVVSRIIPSQVEGLENEFDSDQVSVKIPETVEEKAEGLIEQFETKDSTPQPFMPYKGTEEPKKVQSTNTKAKSNLISSCKLLYSFGL